MPHEEKTKGSRILLHSCCAPCTIYPMERLSAAGFTITGYFYNPNVHPFVEFGLRLGAVSDYYRAVGIGLVVDPAYDVEAFMRAVFAAKTRRCETCWRMRLRAAFLKGKEVGADAVTTTLLYSIYQDHDVVRGIAREESDDSGVEFYYEDFRVGWREGQEQAGKLGIYRQKYCGCIISEQERYKKRIDALAQANRGA
jgi:predicted adenine nucleotide alpha hydrolase (AANH) superfamily ATPase